MTVAETSELIEKVKDLKTKILKLTEKNEEVYGAFYSDLLNIQKQLEQYRTTSSRLPTTSPETKQLVEIKKKIRELGGAARGYIMDYFYTDPAVEYPYVIPNYLSEIGGKHQIAVSPIDRMETIDTFMAILTPGAYVFLYGIPPKKSLLGPWTPSYPAHPACIVRSIPLRKVPRDKLPEEAPYDKPLIDLVIPEEIRLKDLPEREGFRACTVCGAIVDGTGDENCSHPACLVPIRTVPRIYPLINTFVDRAEDNIPIGVALPYPLNEIISSIMFSRKLFITRFMYGAERSFLSQLWKVYFDPLYGYNMETRGIEFFVNQDKARKILRELPTFLGRNLMILYLIHRLSNIIKFYGGTISDARLIFGSALATFVKKEEIPTSGDQFRTMLRYSLERKEELVEYLDKIVAIYFGGRSPTCYVAIKNSLHQILLQLAGFDIEDFRDFVYHVFIHSLKHYVYLSSMLTIGVGSEDISAFVSDKSICVFDDADMGNGCSETLSGMVYIPLETRMSSILTSSAKHELGMYSEDFADVLEELLLGCQSEKLGRMYFDLIRTISLTEIEDFVQRPEKMKELLRRKAPEPLVSPLYGLMKQPAYVHEIIKLVSSYDDVWLYQMFPELFLLLKGDEIKTIEQARKLERIIDALSLCVDGCPNCMLLDRCSYGPISSRFYLSRRLVEHMYETLVKKATLQLSELADKDSMVRIDRIKSTYGVLYARCSKKDFQLSMGILNKILARAEGKCFLTHVHVEPDEYLFKAVFEGGKA